LKNCIIIEDEPLAICILEDYVKKLGKMQIIIKFHRLSEAWSELLKVQPSLILIDMDFKNEIVSVTEVDKILNLGHRIIIVTAYHPNHKLLNNILNRQHVGYLSKPFSMNSFEKEVQKLLPG
jgi:response regulator of citrate/malate metabolism